MDPIVNLPYVSWDRFKRNIGLDLFDGGNFVRGRYLFRGQRKPSWALETSFDRKFKEYGDYATKRKIEQMLFAMFKKELEGTELSINSKKKLNVLAYAQHHGMPTRLLDWTLSPYIAAFFAFADAVYATDNEHDVAIWVLDTESGIWDKSIGVAIKDPPGFGNIRLRAQQGKFTLSTTPYPTLQEYVENCDFTIPPLKLILIPSRHKFKAISDLDLMGINHSQLFPGADGCAKTAEMRAVLSFNQHT